MGIPLVDLRAQQEQVRAEVEEGWAGIFERSAFVLAPEVAAFEEQFAAFSGVDHCVAVASGTDALELALRAVEIGPGDEVVLPANTFIATALAVVRAGATPVLVDVDPDTLLMDARAAEGVVTSRTRAILPVHLYGQMAPMEAIAKLAVDADLDVIEDAAQAHGARQDGRLAGSFGRLAGTSFYPGKNLGAYGDGGAVLTDDADLADRVRALGNYGSNVKYHHPVIGFNSRLDSLQAVVLSAKLRRLAGWNARRREAAERYDELLRELDGAVQRPVVAEGNEPVWHLYVVQVDRRDDVLGRLQADGIGAGVHYPVPIHLHGAFASMGRGRGSFPVSEHAARRLLSLPLFPEITPAQQELVVDRLRSALC